MTDEAQTRPWLTRQCEYLKGHVLARDLADEDEVSGVWPDDEENAPLEDWVRCYGALRAWVWQQDEVPTRTEEAEERVLAALREEPESILLPASNEWVEVHPKGLHALLWFRSKDWLVGWLAGRIEALRGAAEDGALSREEIDSPVSVFQRAHSELAFQLSAIAAVACSPGPGLDEQIANNPPPRFLALDPIDLYRINAAFVEVNAGRMEALQAIVRPRRNEKDDRARMSWSVFASTLAMKLKTDPATLAKDRSLVSLLATVSLSNALDDDIEDDIE